MSGPRPGPAYGIVVRAEYPNVPGMLGTITSTVGSRGGDISSVVLVSTQHGTMIRDLGINTSSLEHARSIVEGIAGVPGVRVITASDETFRVHVGGKLEILARTPVKTPDDLSKAYTPGVGRVCMAIHAEPDAVWGLTSKGNAVAVVTDGTAVLGLGDIGPEAAMPVMEGKAVLFKVFGGVDAWPICLATKDPDEIIDIVKAIAPSFGGINLEDISAPRCFYIEDRLKKELDIPVFHDDQHGTAVVVLAGLINALKVVKKRPEDLKLVIVGAGAAGNACAKILMGFGVKNIIAFDRQGSLCRTRDYGDNEAKRWMADNTNPDDLDCALGEGLKNADCFLGLAGPGIVTTEEIAGMGPDAIVFAMANPIPEILPEEIPDNVRVMATGRTDYPNQVNNALCFPGLYRGVLDVLATDINEEMKLAAARGIAAVITEDRLAADCIIPSMFDEAVASTVAREVARAAIETGVARRSGPGEGKDYSTLARG